MTSWKLFGKLSYRRWETDVVAGGSPGGAMSYRVGVADVMEMANER